MTFYWVNSGGKSTARCGKPTPRTSSLPAPALASLGRTSRKTSVLSAPSPRRWCGVPAGPRQYLGLFPCAAAEHADRVCVRELQMGNASRAKIKHCPQKEINLFGLKVFVVARCLPAQWQLDWCFSAGHSKALFAFLLLLTSPQLTQ